VCEGQRTFLHAVPNGALWLVLLGSEPRPSSFWLGSNKADAAKGNVLINMDDLYEELAEVPLDLQVCPIHTSFSTQHLLSCRSSRTSRSSLRVPEVLCWHHHHRSQALVQRHVLQALGAQVGAQ